jgi:putative (di)nucleoside polyphosphate hydrolase
MTKSPRQAPREPSAEECARLPLRPCVGIMLINARGEVFVGQRVDRDDDAWQMPQGGIDKGESPRRAALRELKEEVGLDAAEVEILAETRDWFSYDLPPRLVPKVWGGKYRGQKQKWFLMRFSGSDEAIDLDYHHREFSTWQWVPAERLPELIVAFKRPIYERLLEEFAGAISGPG